MALVYYITDRKSSALPILEQIQEAIEAKVDLVQIREKDLSSRELFYLAGSARKLARESNTKVLVNDRLDIAICAQLGGVHLGQHSVQPAIIWNYVSEDNFMVAASIHSISELKQLADQPVSFVTLGPVFFTRSKAQFGEPLGLKVLEDVCRNSKVPVLALGGITHQNYRMCLRAGAAGVAGISLFQNPKVPLKELVEEIRTA